MCDEGQRRQQIGEGPLAVNNTKAFFDNSLQVDTSPAYHAVSLWIGAGFHDRKEFTHLLLRQESGTVRTGTVFQAIWPFVIEAMRPISQCLAIHTAEPRRFRGGSGRRMPPPRPKAGEPGENRDGAWPSPEAQGCHYHPEGQ